MCKCTPFLFVLFAVKMLLIGKFIRILPIIFEIKKFFFYVILTILHTY